MFNSFNILDCTFRDGGYYNNWDYSKELINKYSYCIDKSGIEAVEIGFRSLPKQGFLGPLAYSTDNYLLSVNLPKCRVGVMINAKESNKDSVGKLFDKKSNSPVSFVRIASNFKEIEHSTSLVGLLKNLGYDVCINLMQSGNKTEDEIAAAVGVVAKDGQSDVLYFADSLGNIDTDKVNSIFNITKRLWSKDIGFHMHDNKGHAVLNSMHALSLGAAWVDGTILGMGRGSGNAATEILLSEIESAGISKYNAKEVSLLSLSDFAKLKSEYGWGPNIFYHLAAIYNVHPTYVQEMINFNYAPEQILSGLSNLQKWKASSYNHDRLLEAVSGTIGEMHGSWSAKGWLSEREVLIIGSGPSSKKYKEDIQKFIEKKSPFVICLNHSIEYKPDAFALCHSTRIMTEMYKYKDCQCPVLMPKNALSISESINVLDYGVNVSPNQIDIQDNCCVIPNLLVAMYAISAATAAGASKIYLVGFDGYNDAKQKIMVDSINLYKELKNSIPLVSLTPTSYPVEQSSLYCFV